MWSIITTALLAASFSVLTPQELGLKWDNVFLKLDDDKVYTSGRHYVNVGGSFYKFPRKLNYVEYTGGNSVDVWSKDGQEMHLEASFYYKLREDKIFDIFYMMGDKYPQIIEGIAAETIRDVATSFDTLEFFTNRSAIDDAISSALAHRLYTNSYTNMTLFNLLGIGIPANFDDAVIDKVISGQDVIIQTNLRDSLLIQSDIQLTAATAAANITLIQQRAGSEGLIILKRAEAELAQNLLEARALQLKDLSDGLGFTSPDELVKYVYLDVLRAQSTGSNTIVQQNVDTAVIKM